MEPREGSGTTTTVDGADLRTELLGRLGLPADATDADVAAAHRAARALLDHAPEGQRAWAQEQLADVEAVASLLADMDPVPAAPAVAVTARRRPSKLAWVAAVVVLAAGAVFGFHSMSASGVPGIDGAPDPTGSSSPAIDQARVGALMQKITANPKDTASLGELANIYFQAGDYQNSIVFSKKVVAIDPKNDSAWVALGAAQFNMVDQVSAKASWLKAIALNAKNAEAHYDLGFLYLSSDKPDTVAAKKEWQAVIAIDPKSDLAKTVQTHLSSLSSASPAPSASSGS